MRENACAFSFALEGADNVEQVGIVALPGGRRAEVFETFVGIVEGIKAVSPALVAERRIGDDVVEGFERFSVFEAGI